MLVVLQRVMQLWASWYLTKHPKGRVKKGDSHRTSPLFFFFYPVNLYSCVVSLLTTSPVSDFTNLLVSEQTVKGVVHSAIAWLVTYQESEHGLSVTLGFLKSLNSVRRIVPLSYMYSFASAEDIVQSSARGV